MTTSMITFMSAICTVSAAKSAVRARHRVERCHDAAVVGHDDSLWIGGVGGDAGSAVEAKGEANGEAAATPHRATSRRVHSCAAPMSAVPSTAAAYFPAVVSSPPLAKYLT